MERTLHIISQEDRIRHLVHQVGHSHGYDVITNSKATDALLAFSQNYPNVIVLDYDRLTKKDFEVLSKLCVSEYCSSLIVITEADEETDNQTIKQLQRFTNNTICCYSRSLLKNSLAEKLDMINQDFHDLSAKQLRQALAKQEFTLYYQPKVCLKTHEIKAAEALLRWNHPQKGIIGPQNFLATAKKVGLSKEIDYWVINEVFKPKASWHKHQFRLAYSINLSEETLKEPGLLAYLQEKIAQYNINPENICLDIPASTALHSDIYMPLFNSLNRLKFKLSIDGFGRQPFSLTKLADMPFSEIKIEKSYILAMNCKKRAMSLIKAITSLGHALGFDITAVGLETETIWNQLADIGCDYGQGFYLSRPVAADEFKKWLGVK